MKRQWKPVVGLESRYEVSSDGLVRAKPRILKPWSTHDGYLQVNIGGKTRYVHRLVAEAFNPNPYGKRVANHNNGDRTDNRKRNLTWATHGENNAHAYSRGRRPPGETPVFCMAADGEIRSVFRSVKEAARLLGVTPGAIHSAVAKQHRSCGLWWVAL